MVEFGILFLLVRNTGLVLRRKRRAAIPYQVAGVVVFFLAEGIGWLAAASAIRADAAYVGALTLGGIVAYTYWAAVNRLSVLA